MGRSEAKEGVVMAPLPLPRDKEEAVVDVIEVVVKVEVVPPEQDGVVVMGVEVLKLIREELGDGVEWVEPAGEE
jgi:hypothetical protein